MSTRYETLFNLVRRTDAMNYATDNMVRLQAVAAMSFFVNHFRIQLQESTGNYIYPSFLGVLEAPSGAGKNAGVSFALNVLGKSVVDRIESYWDGRVRELASERKTALKLEAGAQFADDLKKMEKHVEKGMKTFWAGVRPINVMQEVAGSFEGFAFDRAWLEKMGLGAPFMFVEEYGDKLVQMKQASYVKNLHSKVIQLVNNDKLMSKSIKSKDGETPGSKGMGITALFTLSSPDVRQKADIRSGVVQAVGRRGHLVKETLLSLDYEKALGQRTCDEITDGEIFSHNESLAEWFDKMQDLVDSGYYTGADGFSTGRMVLPWGDGARQYYKKLKHENVKMYREHALNSFVETKREQATLLKDLDRKSLKLAVTLAVFNHGDVNFELTVDDLKQGGKMAWEFYLSGKDFFRAERTSSVERVIGFLVENGGKASARQMFEAKLFPGVNPRKVQGPILEMFEDYLFDEAEEKGFEITQRKKGKQDLYFIRKLEKAV